MNKHPSCSILHCYSPPPHTHKFTHPYPGTTSTHSGPPIPGWMQYDVGVIEKNGHVTHVANTPLEPDRIYRVATKIRSHQCVEYLTLKLTLTLTPTQTLTLIPILAPQRTLLILLTLYYVPIPCVPLLHYILLHNLDQHTAISPTGNRRP